MDGLCWASSVLADSGSRVRAEPLDDSVCWESHALADFGPLAQEMRCLLALVQILFRCLVSGLRG